MNSKHNGLLRSQFQRSIFLIPFKEIKKEMRKKEPKRPQEKMLSILNYYRSRADQMTTRNPILSDRMAILTVCKQCMEERATR